MSKVIEVTGHLWLRKDLKDLRNFRKKHTNILAAPGYRRLYRPKPKDVPNLDLSGVSADRPTYFIKHKLGIHWVHSTLSLMYDLLQRVLGLNKL